MRVLNITVLRNGNVCSQRTRTEGTQVNERGAMTRRPQLPRHLCGSNKFHAMPLAVIKAERVALESLCTKMRKNHGRIHAAREKHHCTRSTTHDGLATCSSTCCRMRRVVSVSPWCM